MKYIVMECHEGYAVLMDEESRFVEAANLHYEKGQTVTDPVLMNAPQASQRRISVYISRFAAAAACLTLALSAGAYYYSRNYKTHSTVLISSDANISMELNKKGKVLHISAENPNSGEILEDYDGKGKDLLDVANDIIDIEKDKGLIDTGDTVDIYIKAENSADYYSYKSDLITGIPDVKVKVQEYDALKTAEKAAPEPPKPEAEKDVKKPEAPKPPHEDDKHPEPPKPEDNAPPAPPTPDGNAAPAPKQDTPPAPPAPEAPKPPAAGAAAPKPNDKAEPPKPDAHAPAAPELKRTSLEGTPNIAALGASREALPAQPPHPPVSLPNP